MRSNILLDDLPETVMVDDCRYFIQSDFRVMIRFEQLMQDPTIDNRNRVMAWLDLFFGKDIPENIQEAVEAILDFYRCGEPPKKASVKKNGNVEIKPDMIYDYEHDAPYIFGAFLSQYHIDLNDIEYLHWWKFMAMFRSLNSDNKIVEIMGYRSADLTKIEDKKERSRIARMKELYALPQSKTREEKIAAAGMAFGGAFM